MHGMASDWLSLALHQQEGHQLFFDMHFSSLFTTYSSLYYHIGTSTFLNTRHNLYKYILFSFFYLFSRKDWKKAQISFFHPSWCGTERTANMRKCENFDKTEGSIHWPHQNMRDQNRGRRLAEDESSPMRWRETQCRRNCFGFLQKDETFTPTQGQYEVAKVPWSRKARACSTVVQPVLHNPRLTN